MRKELESYDKKQLPDLNLFESLHSFIQPFEDHLLDEDAERDKPLTILLIGCLSEEENALALQ